MKHLLLLIAVCMSLGSCSTIDYLSVDTLMPADVSFAPEVKRVAILNNTVSPAEESNKAPLLNTTLQAEGKNVCERLAEYIANANYFEQVIISDSMLRTDRSDTQAAILSPRQVLDWIRDLQVDMLFVVDDASIQTKSTFAYTTDSGEERVPVVSGALSLETHVYLPGRDRPFQHFLDRDTIYWEADGLTRKQIREDAVEYLAQLPVSHITPFGTPSNATTSEEVPSTCATRLSPCGKMTGNWPAKAGKRNITQKKGKTRHARPSTLPSIMK